MNAAACFVGREQYIEKLQNIFQSNTSLPRLILVGGAPGIGKTTLLNQFLHSQLLPQDLILYGKFEMDTYIPYKGIAGAIESLTSYIQNLPKQNVYTLTLKEVLGSNLTALLNFAPELEPVLGQGEKLEVLPSLESANRFHHVLDQLFTFLLVKHRQLVLFLDDLHWADPDSLNLLERILRSKNNASLIVVSTYRTEQVGISHPLSKLVRNVSNVVELQRLDLEPMNPEEVGALMQNTLNKKLSPEVSDSFFKHSSGNPLFVKELMNTVLSDNMPLPSNPIKLDQIKRLKVGGNVIDLLIIKFKKLSRDSQTLLKQAACLGNEFDMDLMAQLTTLDSTAYTKALRESIAQGVVHEVQNKKTLRFSHDRIRESIYSLIADKEQQHLDIGRELHRIQPNKIATIVDHLNCALQLISDPEEKINLAKMNLTTAAETKNSGSYRSAIHMLCVARDLLSIDSWTSQHDLTYGTYKHLAECHYLNGDYETAEDLYHLISQSITKNTEKLEIHNLEVIQFTNLGQWNRAIEKGMGALIACNIDLENYPEVDSVYQKLLEISREELLSLPLCTDPQWQAIMTLCNSLVSPFYVAKPELLRNLIGIMLQTSMEKGSTKESAYAYTILGMFLGPVYGDYSNANEYALLGVKLNEKLNDLSLRCKIKLTYYTNISPWSNSLRNNLEHLESAAADGLNGGDLVNSGYSHVSRICQLFHAGVPLLEILDNIEAVLPYLVQVNNPAIELTRLTQKFIKSVSMHDPTNHRNETEFNDEDTLKSMQEVGFTHGIHWYYSLKIIFANFFAENVGMQNWIDQAITTSSGAIGQFSLADLNFHHSLFMTHQIAQHPGTFQHLQDQLNDNQAQMEKWAKSCPENFEHMFLLIKAEQNSLQSLPQEQTDLLYQQALEQALSNRFIHNAALCTKRYIAHLNRTGRTDLSPPLVAKQKKLLTQWIGSESFPGTKP